MANMFVEKCARALIKLGRRMMGWNLPPPAKCFSCQRDATRGTVVLGLDRRERAAQSARFCDSCSIEDYFDSLFAEE